MTVGKPPPDFIFTAADMIDAHGGHLEAWQQRARAGLVDADEFLAILHRDLDAAIDVLQADAPTYAKIKKAAGEDAMSRLIVTYLLGARYVATSETNERGHVDIHVRSSRLNLKWNGEAKVHSSYEHALDGMRQLLTRYASGAHPHGGFFLYVRGKKAALVEKKWRKKLAADTDPASCATTGITDDAVNFRFLSTHAHSCGRPYNVRHHIVLMYFKPQDKSGGDDSVADYEEDEDEDDLA